MADQPARLEAATIKAEIGSGIVYRFSNDAASEADIPTLSGAIPNLKNVILRIQNEGAEKISFATKIFIDTAAGIAGTSNQEIFLVQSAEPGEIYEVWQNVSGTAVDTGKRSISAAAVIEATDAATAAAASAQESADAATMRVARFLEPSATPPTQRDDGQPLQLGDRYLNTVDQIEYIYKNSGWVANNVDGQELSTTEGATKVGAILQDGSSGTVQDAIAASSTDKTLRTELAAPNGAGMVGINGFTLSDYLKMQLADVQSYGADPTGVADSTAAFMAAAATGRPVRISSLRTGGKAVYRVGLTSLPANTSLIGDGANSELVPLTSSTRAAITINSSSATTFIDNLIFANFTLRGSVVADGFSEQIHLMTLNGVRNVLVDNVNFIGFRGDGCYIGSGDTGGFERHNHNVTIRRCTFDGLNNDNRNGVSIIDGSNVTIENNVFQNCTRSNMPGAIDIEPDNAAFHVINGINIVRNKFRNIGGNLGTVSLFMGSDVVPDPKNIRIIDNDFDGSVTTTPKADIFIGTSRAVDDGTANSLVQIVGNNGRNGCRALDIHAIKGIRIEGNNWITYTQPSRFGIPNSPLYAPRELYHANNRYIRNASAGGAGLVVGNINYLTNDGNSWEECGNGAAGSAGIDYQSGACAYINHIRNKFKSAGGTMLQGILYSSSGKSPETNTQIGDKFLNSLANQFVAYETDMKWNAYTPVVVGASTAGAGTYTVQYGRFMKQGDIVKYAIHIEVTSHTGTGLLRVSLPMNAQTQTDVTFPAGAATSTGLDGAGSIGLINSGAVAGGVTGAVGLYGYKSAAANTMVQLIIPSGAFSIYHEGTYVAS